MPAPASTPTSGSWILAATILGSSMAFIDGNVVNVALPALQTSLNATASNLQWVVEANALFLAALRLVGGILGDLYGRRRIFLAGVVLFALASAWCGLAPNIHQLIAARSMASEPSPPPASPSCSEPEADPEAHPAQRPPSATATGPLSRHERPRHRHGHQRRPPHHRRHDLRPQEHAGAAYGINNAVSRVASLLALAAFGLIVFQAFSTTLDHRLAALDLAPATRESIDRQRPKLAAIETSNPPAQAAIGSAFLAGYNDVISSESPSA